MIVLLIGAQTGATNEENARLLRMVDIVCAIMDSQGRTAVSVSGSLNLTYSFCEAYIPSCYMECQFYNKIVSPTYRPVPRWL